MCLRIVLLEVFGELIQSSLAPRGQVSPVESKQMKPAARSPLDPHGNRLDTWKEIAVYLDREVRTVQRWEKREGLPVRRHFRVNGGTVYASKKEIDAWLRSRHAPSEPALKKECSEHGLNG